MLFVLPILAAVAEVASTAVTVGTAVSAGVASVGASLIGSRFLRKIIMAVTSVIIIKNKKKGFLDSS